MSAAVTFREVPRRPRLGCKGPLAEAWLHELGLDVPQPANSWVYGANGVLVARLATSEFLVEALAGGDSKIADAAQRLHEPSARRAGLYPVLREDCVFELSGARANEVLLETCNVNFAPLAAAAQDSAGTVVMTMMVGVGVAIIVRPAAQYRLYSIWCDPSFGHYLQSTIENITKQLEDPV
jgi:sarcosine oxidase, subunit gamma